MWKQSGALMSSRLIPPKVGSSNWHNLMISSGSCVFTSISKTSTSAKRLKSTALPSITDLPASAPMSPSPSTAVPLLSTATRLPRPVYLNLVQIRLPIPGSRVSCATRFSTAGLSICGA